MYVHSNKLNYSPWHTCINHEMHLWLYVVVRIYTYVQACTIIDVDDGKKSFYVTTYLEAWSSVIF